MLLVENFKASNAKLEKTQKLTLLSKHVILNLQSDFHSKIDRIKRLQNAYDNCFKNLAQLWKFGLI